MTGRLDAVDYEGPRGNTCLGLESPSLWSPRSLKFSTYKMTALEDPVLPKALYVLKFMALIEHFLCPGLITKSKMPEL